MTLLNEERAAAHEAVAAVGAVVRAGPEDHRAVLEELAGERRLDFCHESAEIQRSIGAR